MIAYIAKRGPFDIGSKMHLQAVKEIYGDENVFVIDFLEPIGKREKNYISYGRTNNYLERIPRWLQGNISYISNKIIEEICSLVIEMDIRVIFSEESDFGNLMKRIKETCPNTRIISFYHDISADLFAQRKKNMPGRHLPHKYIEFNLTICQERINQKYCDENWVFHDCDASKFFGFYGYYPTVKIPLAAPVPEVPNEVKASNVKADELKKLLFVCSKYYVNKLGFRWFHDNVLMGLDDDFELSVIGRGSLDLKGFCSDKRVRLIGSVDSLKEYYLNADIVITPIFDGGGMKVKTIEAVSYAKCIVGTEESLHGFWEAMTPDVKNKIVFQEDTVEGWIKALKILLHTDTKKFNPELDKVFRNRFSYEAMLADFKKYLPTTG